MVVDNRRPGLSISKIADLLGFSATVLSRVYTVLGVEKTLVDMVKVHWNWFNYNNNKLYFTKRL